MSAHIGAKRGDIAESVLLPGDPLRARFIAESYLENIVCYNEVRGMFGFTGTFKGKPVSIQGTGMGIPSLSIYVEELIRDHGCKTLIRVGSCGSIQENIKIRDIVLGMGACTDSSTNYLEFEGMSFAPIADFDLLKRAHDYATANGISVKVGNIMATDRFYNPEKSFYEIWKKHGVLAFEMETSALYTIAARNGVRALTILTVSDSILTGEALSALERERIFHEMFDIALNVV
ncbi:MAG: purine-nucleoside phosphorylase [Candidatus Xenobiia bacterium LiM19]